MTKRGETCLFQTCKDPNIWYTEREGVLHSYLFLVLTELIFYPTYLIGEETARQRFQIQLRNQSPNYIIVLREYGGSKLVYTTIIDPTGQSPEKLAVTKIVILGRFFR